MRLILRKREVIFETIPQIGRRASHRSNYNLNRVNNSFVDLRQIKTNSSTRAASPKRAEEASTSTPASNRQENKKEHLVVYDIIICELFPKEIKITSLSNGIYELLDLSELHRELFVTFLANLLPNERLRECSTECGTTSRPYVAKRNSSLCSFDTCDSVSLTMDRFTVKKLNQAKVDESMGGYFQRKITYLSYNLSTIWNNCACNVICGDQDQISDEDNTIKLPLDDRTMFSYEEETISSTPQRTSNLSPKPKSLSSEGEEGSFIENNKRTAPYF